MNDTAVRYQNASVTEPRRDRGTAQAVDEESLNKKCTVLVITFYYLVGRDNANQMLLCGAGRVVVPDRYREHLTNSNQDFPIQ